jgi:hypothetical protein
VTQGQSATFSVVATGASLAYQISAMVSGFTPFVTTLLFVRFGWIGPALLFSLYAAIGLVAAGWLEWHDTRRPPPA